MLGSSSDCLPLLVKTVRHAYCLPACSFRSTGDAGRVPCCCCCCCGAPLFYSTQARSLELVESDWDFAAIITKQLAEWKRRGVGNSYQEALLKEVIELQTRALLRPISLPAEELQPRALLRPISLPAEEGSLMVQLNATYRSIEESMGRLLPEQTKEQLSLLEALVRKPSSSTAAV
ncbi:hypothetical protein Esi_0947_0001 [Ectocarpus siliculosus]|uniref:Uncharacterized protein n=1 Tax=Ectocarpus siliculosus TaxID=2880 RepID=D7G945_ECTSI|nr:hypothetical protein Esi_0947_0001 [Ectocarpus siliculosus]|eukprot:CBJ34078.1 hypothetical protein Esi_0947_0001 [Ectocarpus siliculosus]